MSRSKTLVILVLVGMCSVLPGCLGRMALTRNVEELNRTVASDIWSRELVFLGLHIVPVYPMSVLGDLFVVNSVEFWSGDNPITREPALVDEKD